MHTNYFFRRFFIAFVAALALAFFVPQSHAYTPDTLVKSHTAGMSLEVPQKVHDGRAFVVKVALENPVPSVLVDWLGKTYTVPTTISSDAYGHSHATLSCLFAVPLDTKSGTHTLTVEASSDHILSQAIAIEALQYPVQALTVEPKYVQPPESVLNQIARDRAKVKPLLNAQTPMSTLFGMQKPQFLALPLYRPVKGIVTSPFGVHRVFNNQPKGSHMGLDLRGATGTPIHACADGRVVLAEELYYAGNAVYVDHGLGVITAYMHLSAFAVKEGDMVKAGDLLGKVGMTGRVTGPHLHLSLYVFGVSVDPLPLLQDDI
ncbi:MAG: M23 family metallopeptidase [Pseudomonadota bacterium]